jgi:hypothetical protein
MTRIFIGERLRVGADEDDVKRVKKIAEVRGQIAEVDSDGSRLWFR